MEYDVIVVGGGPGGSTAASFLSRAGKNVLLLDRATFPRDKTCGDATSGKSVKILQELGIIDRVEKLEHRKMYGVIFSSPKGTVVHIDSKEKRQQKYPGFICPRFYFDNVLFQNAKSLCETHEQFMVKEVIQKDGFVVGVKGTDLKTNTDREFYAKVVVGADGAAGVVAKQVGSLNTDISHQVSAVRTYYDGVEGLKDAIELHFVPGLIPGYFWIFPLPGKKANVGVGMIVRDMQKNKLNLQSAMFDAIAKHPLFKERFRNAKLVDKVKSWHLPLGSKETKRYGNGFVLVGDAASLIDPFSGEGIGNSIVSGKVAAQTILEAFEKNDFSEKTLIKHQEGVKRELGPALSTSYKLQQLGQNTFLLNWVIDKAARSERVRSAISSALIDPEAQKKFASPLFLLQLILLW